MRARYVSRGPVVIVYNLSCVRGHEFEGWFTDSATYDSQEQGGTLVCPLCGDSKIRKAMMAPALVSSAAKPDSVAPPVTPEAKANADAIRQYAAGLRKFIENNAEYVGPRFAEEARKIHYGEAEERHIYGESTVNEAKELIDEGIEIAPFPVDPEDMN
jgi:hypothetical protein